MGGSNETVCVNETSRVANVTIHADKIEITHFNTYNNPVSIAINSTFTPDLELLRYSNVSGTYITGFTFPEGGPSQSLDSVFYIGWFFILFFYEGVDTEVSFEYWTWSDAHVDNWVTVTYPEYYVAIGLGFILLSIGILAAMATLYLYMRTKTSN
jgi:hypothetical protein